MRSSFTAGQGTHDLLRYAEDLLGYRLDSSEMEQIFAAGLAALIAKLERSKFAATDRPRPQNQPARWRHVPVWQRDQGRCTFISESGRRCDARRFLQFDHIEPVARGGKDHGRESAPALPGAQSVRGRACVRSRVHARDPGRAARGRRGAIPLRGGAVSA